MNSADIIFGGIDMGKYSAIEGEVVVLLDEIAMGRCRGKTGREMQKCIVDELHKIWKKPPPFFEELNYLSKQLKSQKTIHSRIIESLNNLKGSEYPDEKIESIREEFNMPIDERSLDPVGEYLKQLLPVDEDTRKVAERWQKKESLTEADFLLELMNLYARTEVKTEKLGELKASLDKYELSERERRDIEKLIKQKMEN